MCQGDSPSAAGATIRLTDSSTLGYTEYGNPPDQSCSTFTATRDLA